MNYKDGKIKRYLKASLLGFYEVMEGDYEKDKYKREIAKLWKVKSVRNIN